MLKFVPGKLKDMVQSRFADTVPVLYPYVRSVSEWHPYDVSISGNDKVESIEDQPISQGQKLNNLHNSLQHLEANGVDTQGCTAQGKFRTLLWPLVIDSHDSLVTIWQTFLLLQQN